MRLQKLRLQNFRQHADSTIEFRPGLTGIIGPNGAGKTTILEAIAWAVYGKSAARGNNDSIRFSRAAPRAKVTVDFTFELDNHEYRITRTLNSAEVYLDNSLNPVAVGVTNTTAYLQARLGMTRDEFFNTYFTGQKELQFLAQLGPADRARFFAQVLGYERLRRAQEIAKGRRQELNAEIVGLKTGLPDPAALKAERESAEERLKDAKKSVAQILKTLQKLQVALEVATPLWKSAQEAKEKSQKLTLQIESVARQLEAAQRDVDRAAADRQKVDDAEKSLAAIKPQLDELSAVATATERQEELSRAYAQRRILKQNEERLVAEIAKLTVALEALQQAPVLLNKAQDELIALKKQLPEATEIRETLLKDWQQDAQDNRTKLLWMQDGEKELEDQIRRLKTAGEAGNCPVCTKPLGDEYETVLEHLEDELFNRKSEVKWRQQREKQLVVRPPELVQAEDILAQLHASLERKTEREAKCQKAIEDLWKTTEDKQDKEKQLVAQRAQLAAVPAGYDPAEHTALRTRLAELQQFARQASVFEHEIAARNARDVELTAALERKQQLDAQQAKLRAEFAALEFDETAYETARTTFERLNAEAHAAQIAGAEAKQALAGAEEAIFNAQRAQASYEEKREKLTALESDLRHHLEMDVALTRLRAELNDRVRPELASLASEFLADITDGRYNALEIDDSYDVVVLEDGEEKPVISGGEEDVANLVLRIAISQMIAERAGQQLSTLFLDEVFAALDVERRDNVIQLLQKLHDRFEQVILITHIETVREGLDNVIRIAYDERTGASVVKANEETAPELMLI